MASGSRQTEVSAPCVTHEVDELPDDHLVQLVQVTTGCRTTNITLGGAGSIPKEFRLLEGSRVKFDDK